MAVNNNRSFEENWSSRAVSTKREARQVEETNNCSGYRGAGLVVRNNNDENNRFPENAAGDLWGRTFK